MLKVADYKLPEDYERYFKAVREFVYNEMEDFSREIERIGRIPDYVVPALREAGLLNLTHPKNYGGHELGALYWPIMEEVAKSHGTIRMLVHSFNGTLYKSIYDFGSQKMKDKYMPLLSKAEWLAAWVITEPGTGTGVDIKTTATKEGNKYYLNGKKHLCSFADLVDAICTFAYTDKSLGRNGITAFLVDKKAQGLTISEMPECMGLHGSYHGILTFKDCEVPEDMVIGKVGQGLDIALHTLDRSRMSIGTCCVGAAQRMLELSVEYAKKRVTFGKPIERRQAVQGLLAEMATDIAAARALVHEVQQKYERGEDIRQQASMAKLFGLDIIERVGSRAMEIHGGLGYTKTFDIERRYRDATSMRFEEGTPTLQKLVIARGVLKC